MLPPYSVSSVDLSPDEHLGSEPLYEAIRKAQAAMVDGFQAKDLLEIPEIANMARASVEWIVVGDKNDPTDDEAIADRLVTLGFAITRASQLLKKKKAEGGEGGTE